MPRALMIQGTASHVGKSLLAAAFGRWLRDRPGIAGATDLGDARAVLVLDPEALVAGANDGHAHS